MKLFDTIKGDLFSVLASPNKGLYADALDVLYDAFQDHLKIPESTYYSMLRSRLERELAEATFEDEDIDEEELRDISGRTRFLIRKLYSKGWFEKERGQDFEEYIIVPSYSIRMLELFRSLTEEAPLRGYSFVFATYSALKVSNEDNQIYNKMTAVYSAYENTHSLIKMLKTVYHNVNRFFQLQIEMQQVDEVLAAHFDDFGQRVMEAYIRPLKIKDSVPKFRVPIQAILSSWVEDNSLLFEMASAAFQDKRGDSVELCRGDLIKKLFWINERYDSLETEYLNEIDAQVRRYTRATTQKIENLTNRDQNLRGNINYLLSALSRNKRAGELIDSIQPAFDIYEQTYLSEKSLWFRRRPVKRERSQPVFIEDEPVSVSQKEEMEKLLNHKYGKGAVKSFMRQIFADENVRYSKDIGPVDDSTYILSLLAVLNSLDKDSFYKTEALDGRYHQGKYDIPQIRFVRKEKR